VQEREEGVVVHGRNLPGTPAPAPVSDVTAGP
jgi:hypothetical protein